MPLCRDGIRTFCMGVIVPLSPPMDATNTYIAVGSSNTPYSYSQQALVRELAKKKVDTGFPKLSGTTISLQTTFGPTEANGEWYEWAVFRSTTNMINRIVQAQCNKLNGQTWIFKVTLNINII